MGAAAAAGRRRQTASLPGLALARQLVGGLEHFRQLQHQDGAVAAERVERAGLDQRLQRAAVELADVHALAEVQQVAERAARARASTIASQAPRPTPFTAPRP